MTEETDRASRRGKGPLGLGGGALEVAPRNAHMNLDTTVGREKAMEQGTRQYFIIDFDNTFIKSAGLEELAAIALKNNPNKESVLEKIKALTTLGIEGKIPLAASLEQRLALFQANRQDVERLATHLKREISDSILRNKQFFKTFKDHIYIISDDFKDFIIPVVKPFGIPEDHVFANTFIYDDKDNIIGFDQTNPLSQEDGKVKLVQALDLHHADTYVIGGRYTDYKLKELGLVKEFIAFTENIERDDLVEYADRVAPTFDEFLYVNRLPRSLSYPKNRINVMLLENIDQDAVTWFEKEGYEVNYYEKSLSQEELAEKIKNVFILGIRSRTHITPQVLQNADHLLAIGAYCIGTNQIDLLSCAQQGITVFNAPYSNTRSVVELIIGEIIMLLRDVVDKSNKMHNGIWDKSASGAHEIRGKTLGIIGYGNIGSQLSVLAENLGMKVIFYDIVEKLALGNARRCKTMEELLRTADIITVHVDGNPQNVNLIAEKEFRAMKDGVIFLNASRGFVIEIAALAKYLQNGKIKGAAIDVFPKEPQGKGDPFISELQQFPNVILTPHIGGSTEEAQKNIAEFVSSKIIAYINTGNTHLSVNIPNIQVPPQNHTHRLLHLHKNVPGIMARINSILAEHNINIEGQYLKTNEQIGYVITDVNKKYDVQVLDILKKIPDTIRFRVLY
jgi:D-3-phosphoglycerate dehydrogenase